MQSLDTRLYHDSQHVDLCRRTGNGRGPALSSGMNHTALGHDIAATRPRSLILAPWDPHMAGRETRKVNTASTCTGASSLQIPLPTRSRYIYGGCISSIGQTTGPEELLRPSSCSSDAFITRKMAFTSRRLYRRLLAYGTWHSKCLCYPHRWSILQLLFFTAHIFPAQHTTYRCMRAWSPSQRTSNL